MELKVAKVVSYCMSNFTGFSRRLSPPTVRIKAYSDQEARVIESIVLYMCTNEKTDRVTWQVTNMTGVPILGRAQAKLMNYISYPDIHAPKNQEHQPVSATDYVHSLETVYSLKRLHSLWTVSRLHPQLTRLPRNATRVKSTTAHGPKSPQVSWCRSAVTINGKTHPLPTTKEYILHEYADIFRGIGTLPGDLYHIKLKDSYKPVHSLPTQISATGNAVCL